MQAQSHHESMEIQRLLQHQRPARLRSHPPPQDFRLPRALLRNVDALRRLEIRRPFFLHGLYPAPQQPEHPFEGPLEAKEDLQSACGARAAVDVGGAEELQYVEHFGLITVFI